MGYWWSGSGFNVGPVTSETTLCTLTNLFSEILFDDWHSTEFSLIRRLKWLKGFLVPRLRIYQDYIYCSMIFNCSRIAYSLLRFCVRFGNCCNLKTDFGLLRKRPKSLLSFKTLTKGCSRQLLAFAKNDLFLQIHFGLSFFSFNIVCWHNLSVCCPFESNR